MRLPRLSSSFRVNILGKNFEFGIFPFKETMLAENLERATHAFSWLMNAMSNGHSSTSKTGMVVTLLLTAVVPGSGHYVDQTVDVYHPPCGYRGQVSFNTIIHQAPENYINDVQALGAETNIVQTLTNTTLIEVCKGKTFAASNWFINLLVQNFSFYQNEPFHAENMALLKDACQQQEAFYTLQQNKTIACLLLGVAEILALQQLNQRVLKVDLSALSKKLLATSSMGGLIYTLLSVFLYIWPTDNLGGAIGCTLLIPLVTPILYAGSDKAISCYKNRLMGKNQHTADEQFQVKKTGNLTDTAEDPDTHKRLLGASYGTSTK